MCVAYFYCDTHSACRLSHGALCAVIRIVRSHQHFMTFFWKWLQSDCKVTGSDSNNSTINYSLDPCLLSPLFLDALTVWSMCWLALRRWPKPCSIPSHFADADANLRSSIDRWPRPNSQLTLTYNICNWKLWCLGFGTLGYRLPPMKTVVIFILCRNLEQQWALQSTEILASRPLMYLARATISVSSSLR